MTEHTNHVELRGRVSVDPAERELPSGDTIVQFRLVVPRTGAVLRRSKQKIDVIECTAWSAALRRKALRLIAGDEVAVRGQLRRRFSRGTPGHSWMVVDLERVGAG